MALIVISDHVKDWLEVETLINIPYSFVLFSLDLLVMDMPSSLSQHLSR